MNSDLSGTTTRTTTRPRMPFLGRTLCRGPTKNWDVPQAQVDDKVFQQLNLLITIGINLTCKLVEINNGDDDGDGDDAEKRDIRQILAGGQVRSVA